MALSPSAASLRTERELNEREPGFVGLIVLVQICWVFERLVTFDKAAAKAGMTVLR